MFAIKLDLSKTYISNSPSKLQDLTNLTSGPERLMCKHCGFVCYNQRKSAMRHLHLYHDFPYKCTKCDAKYRGRNQLRVHYSTAHNLHVIVPNINMDFKGSFETVNCVHIGVYMRLDQGWSYCQDVHKAVQAEVFYYSKK